MARRKDRAKSGALVCSQFSVRGPSNTAALHSLLTKCGHAGSALSVESRMGAVAWGRWPTRRSPSPLVELDVPISGIQLSDGFTARHTTCSQWQAFETQQAA